MTDGLLRRLQATVERLHDVRLDLDVTAYLVDDATRQKLTPGLHLPEQLLVSEQQDVVELALYLHPDVVSLLQRDDPHVRLHNDNHQAFCIALEGISHFVYVAWRAAAGWSTTALELELQAEVDKFVASWLLLHAQGYRAPQVPRWLMRRCFGDLVLHAAVPAAQHRRYALANRGAAAFCGGLVDALGSRAVTDRYLQAVVQQVRRFSRHALASKIAG